MGRGHVPGPDRLAPAVLQDVGKPKLLTAAEEVALAKRVERATSRPRSA